MPSRALNRWTTTSAEQLDQIADAHAAIGGKKPGRRSATEQINHAYVLLLAAALQGFCRDLHTESVNALLGSLKPSVGIETVLLAIASHGRQLDSRNATRATIAADFNPLGVRILDELKPRRPTNQARLLVLDRMNDWRNAIAHQSFDRKVLDPPKLHLKTVGIWRRQCTILASDLDRVMRAHLGKLVGTAPR
jgi:hypothetical protein